MSLEEVEGPSSAPNFGVGDGALRTGCKKRLIVKSLDRPLTTQTQNQFGTIHTNTDNTAETNFDLSTEDWDIDNFYLTQDQDILSPAAPVAEETLTMSFEHDNDDIEKKQSQVVDDLFPDLQMMEQESESEQEQVFELEVPVQMWAVTGQGNSLFDIEAPTQPREAFETNPEACQNPMEVEGHAAATGGPDVLLDIMADDATPLEEQDLLNFVLNEAIQPDDPAFQAFIATEEEEPVDVKPDLDTIDVGALIGPSTSQAAEVVVKRGRGRPRLPRTEPQVARRPRGRPPTAASVALITDLDDSSSAMSGSELRDHKYRRMRDLNNAASKRCRVNRRRKFDVMEVNEATLQEKNTTLKIKVQLLEEQVARFKQAFIQKIKANNDRFDLDAFLDAKIDGFNG